MERIITKTESATFKLGEKFGRQCVGGEVFLLIGDLGAGKTKLLQGLAAGLGVKSKVNSPTFNILKIYQIASRKDSKSRTKAFCHIDAYRLKAGADLISLGVEEYFNSPETVIAIEWADKVKDIWPRGAQVIRLRALSEGSREIIIE
jgi:tRNA threonylcarbamoyladenosine biosynthesis protein TsaE